MNERAIHSHGVYLSEARSRRNSNFYWMLMGWAANARRRAFPMKQAVITAPVQGSLF